MAAALARTRPLTSRCCPLLHGVLPRSCNTTVIAPLQSSTRRDLNIRTNHERIAQACAPKRSALFSPRIQWRPFSDQKDPRLDKNAHESSQPSLPTTSSPINAFKHENIYTLPNALTLSRLLSAPAIGYLLLTHQPTLALGLFVYAGATDLIDGWLARRWKQESVVGSVLDPAGDKALMTCCTICLGWLGALPVPLALTILSRDVILSLWAFYIRYSTLPAPRTLSRYWDFSIPSAEVKPTQLSKVNTFLQLGLIGTTMGVLGLVEGGVEGLGGEEVLAGYGGVMEMVLEASWWVVGATTVSSGVGYFRGGRGWKVVK